MRELIVFVKNEELAVRGKRYNEFYGHTCTAHEMEQRARTFTPEERRAIARVQEFSKHANLVVRILSIRNLWARLRYRLVRDERTPVVVCGSKVFRGVPTMEELSRLVR